MVGKITFGSETKGMLPSEAFNKVTGIDPISYDAMCVTNIFAFRATEPRRMMKATDPIGYGNDRWLVDIAKDASLIVAAWSQHGAFNNRAAAVRKLLKPFPLHYLKITNQPWHPLYLPDRTLPSLWRYQ